MLGIEADGGEHYEDKGRQKDRLRAGELNEFGVKIVRFSDREILANIDGVYETIQSIVGKRKANPPHLNPLLNETVS
jgi:very-short-patch-repair endonuclease